jgi:hypothetical protein
MATVKVLVSGRNKYIVNITHTWVTADETNVVVVDRSALIGPDGVNPPREIRVDEITWSCSPALDTVKLSWDLATDEVIENLHGAGYLDYRPYGGKNPGTAAATATEGDILLSTVGGAANDSYSVLLHCTLKS